MVQVFTSIEGFSTSSEIKAAVRHLASTIEFARNEAISSGETLYLEYNLEPDRQGYRVVLPFVRDNEGKKIRSEDIGENESELFSFHRIPDRVRITHIYLPGNDEVQERVVRMAFTPTGHADPHIVDLSTRKEDYNAPEFSIEVNPLTGFVEFYDYSKQFETADEADF